MPTAHAATTREANHDACCCFPKLAELIDYLQGLKGRADLTVLAKLLGKLNVTREDLKSACQFGTKSYRRNVIASSPWFELLALTWRSGHCTPIHDHRGVSCAFRVVHGVGTEIRFKQTASGLVCPVETNEMQPGYVCAAEDADIHQVANMQARGHDLITLHIYSPRIKKMHTYTYACSNGSEGTSVYDSAAARAKSATPRSKSRPSNSRR